MRRVPRCGQKRDDPSIHCDSLHAALTLSVLWDLRYYATSSTSNSTLSLHDFGHKFYWASLSILTPTLLDLNYHSARAVRYLQFFSAANENFLRFTLDSIGKEGRHSLAGIIDYAILGRERKREPFFVTVPMDKLYFSNNTHFFFLSDFAIISRMYFNNVILLFTLCYIF